MTGAVQEHFARSASDQSRAAAAKHSHGHRPWSDVLNTMSRVAAKESFAAPQLLFLKPKNHGLRPWLRSAAAPRLKKDAAAPHSCLADRLYRRIVPYRQRTMDIMLE